MRVVYVAGMLWCTHGEDVVNTPINQSVVFVKERDITLTNDRWKIIVHFDLTAFEDVITTLHEGLTRAKESRRATPVGELRQVDVALSSFEDKLANLKQYLPKADRRRGLINAGGSILKAIFGLATNWDLEGLRTTVDALHSKQGEIAHSMNQQVTYLKQLDGTVRFNHQAIANLSATLKDIAMRSQEKFQEIATKLEWGNLQREAATTIRELEFTLTQLEISIDELINAIQYVMIGRVPVNLINPTMLQDMLKNVALVLPEGCELIIGLSPNNVYLYYEVIQTAMLADMNNFKLVLDVPIKTVSRQYELYKTVVLPTRILNNTFAWFEVGDNYFAINLLQRTYLTLSEEEVSKCRGEHIKICPINRAVYSTEVNSCALSLFLQSSQVREVCKRTVSTHPGIPRLERYGNVVIYYLNGPKQLHLQCQHNRSWETHTMTLDGAGVLQNTESCYLTMQGLQLYPALTGESEFAAQTPVLVTPFVPAVASDREMEILRQMPILNGTHLDQLTTSISSHHIQADIDTLFNLHMSNLQHASKINGTALGLIVTGVVLILFILYYFTHFYIWNLVKTCIATRNSSVDNSVQKDRGENPSPLHSDPTKVDSEDVTEPVPQARYSIYSLQAN